jgi:hypothetical protein
VGPKIDYEGPLNRSISINESAGKDLMMQDEESEEIVIKKGVRSL